MNADDLRARVTDFCRTHAASLGLDPHSITVEYVLNWGGFVNYSYRIRDRQRSYHLKLSTSVEGQAALRRWHALAPLLEPYHAPPVLDWIDLGPAAGLLFPFIVGRPPQLHDDVVAQLLSTLSRLNADRDVAAALETPRVVTAHDYYLATLHDRFTEDLIAIRAAPPPFVSKELLDWLTEEAQALSQAIADTPASAEPLTSPVHGDLWLNNVIWESAQQWSLVDWDDLRIGDPALDVATLIGPDARDVRPLKLLDRVGATLTATQRERLPYLGRATLLDWVIDPLADWMDAPIAAAHESVVRPEKERIHRQALAEYEKRYR